MVEGRVGKYDDSTFVVVKKKNNETGCSDCYLNGETFCGAILNSMFGNERSNCKDENIIIKEEK